MIQNILSKCVEIFINYPLLYTVRHDLGTLYNIGYIGYIIQDN